MMPITMAKSGDNVVIRKITGSDKVRQHLAELGFVVDGRVTVVNEIAGNLILQVKDSRIALDKSMQYCKGAGSIKAVGISDAFGFDVQASAGERTVR